jgi:hypothetical protein
MQPEMKTVEVGGLRVPNTRAEGPAQMETVSTLDAKTSNTRLKH